MIIIKFIKTGLPDSFVIDIEQRCDERGFFARVACSKEFGEVGLNARFVQMNMQNNIRRGTLRGMHYQLSPSSEEKLVRCTKGALFDVIVNLRKGSPEYGKWFGVELNEKNRRMIYIPKGYAHGYLTLSDDTEAFYAVTEFYTPAQEAGIRFDDPAIGITWPEPILTVSEKDKAWPFL